jgi:Ca2+-binding EF-hand superfamily protein
MKGSKRNNKSKMSTLLADTDRPKSADLDNVKITNPFNPLVVSDDSNAQSSGVNAALVDIKEKQNSQDVPKSLVSSKQSDLDEASAGGGDKLKNIMIHQRLFAKFDLDGDGLLDAHEIEQMLHGMGFDSEPEYVTSVVEKFDSDGSGKLDLSKFEDLWAYLMSANVEKSAESNLASQRAASVMNRTLDEQRQHMRAESALRRLYYSTKTTSVDDVKEDLSHHVSQRVEEMMLEKVCLRVNTDAGTGLDKEELVELFLQLGSEDSDYKVDSLLEEFDFDEAGEITMDDLKEWYFGGQTHVTYQDLERMSLTPWSTIVPEYLTLLSSNKGSTMDEEELRSMFLEMDEDNSGSVDADEVAALASRLGARLSKAELEEAMLEV